MSSRLQEVLAGKEAKARGMKVWVLDVDHFPTGHAAGKLKDAPKELRRLFLSEMHVDAIGPQTHYCTCRYSYSRYTGFRTLHAGKS